MMKSLSILIICTLSLLACRNNNRSANNALEGNWRMTMVKEISNGQTHLKPQGTIGDVALSLNFISATEGQILGNTPTNTLTGSFIIAANNRITFTAVSATKVAETTWGNYFYSNTLFIERYALTTNGLLELSTPNLVLQFERP